VRLLPRITLKLKHHGIIHPQLRQRVKCRWWKKILSPTYIYTYPPHPPIIPQGSTKYMHHSRKQIYKIRQICILLEFHPHMLSSPRTGSGKNSNGSQQERSLCMQWMFSSLFRHIHKTNIQIWLVGISDAETMIMLTEFVR